jgi:hypothetical protein
MLSAASSRFLRGAATATMARRSVVAAGVAAQQPILVGAAGTTSRAFSSNESATFDLTGSFQVSLSVSVLRFCSYISCVFFHLLTHSCLSLSLNSFSPLSILSLSLYYCKNHPPIHPSVMYIFIRHIIWILLQKMS